MAKENTESSKDGRKALMVVLNQAVRIPGMKVDRERFLREQFASAPRQVIDDIVKRGPLAAGCDRKILLKMARQIVLKRTGQSTGASFLAGVPGGFTMAATIPADVAQFYAFVLKTAQEIAYLYGEEDFWEAVLPDDGVIGNQLLLYLGVMLGLTGASSAVRLISTQLGKSVLKRLPQKALTKGVIYPIVKSVAKTLSVKMTKKVFATGVSKAVPIIGGALSGGITWTTMRPMGMHLISVMDGAHFGYSQSDADRDYKTVLDLDMVNSQTSENPQASETSNTPTDSEDAETSDALTVPGVAENSDDSADLADADRSDGYRLT